MRTYKLKFNGEYIPQDHDIPKTDWYAVSEWVAMALIFIALMVVLYYINVANAHMAELMAHVNANAVIVK